VLGQAGEAGSLVGVEEGRGSWLKEGQMAWASRGSGEEQTTLSQFKWFPGG